MQKTAYDVRISDWSSDVCSSDLRVGGLGGPGHARCAGAELEGLQPSAAIDGEALCRARIPFYDQPCAARILNNRRGKAAVGGIERLLQTEEAVVVWTDGDGNRLAVGRIAGGRRKSAGHEN